MYKLIATGLIALDILLFLTPTVQAQKVAVKEDCTATINAAQSRIAEGRNVEVSIRSQDISESYPDHPESRPYNYLFLMEGAATDSIMNSPQFMKLIANNVINNCGSVSSVTFALNQSGWNYSIGLLSNGKIDFFDCIEHEDYNVKLNWGQQYCTL
ncbi:hypothetical protein ACEYW6_27965 [Nostoc sp. UIC 10607]|uniref:hypothetical protein n=1 Tax=Nostoc sp. UIC 10607 TaxID=3045935 RepID=UPI0039A174E0